MPVEALASELDVTPQTIRRDIGELCADGLLQRYHGGATLGDAALNDTYLLQKKRQQNEKAHIADLIAAEIPDGSSLFMSIGATIEAVAAALIKNHRNLRIITNNIHVAASAPPRAAPSVTRRGGGARRVDGGITGVATVDFINQFKADYAILGSSSIEADGSLLDFDFKEVSVMQAMMQNARTRYLSVEHNQTGRTALVRVAAITEFDKVFSDRPLPAKPGERVRFWVLNAGPSEPMSFHCVGLQFDQVFFEGAWTLRGPDRIGAAWSGGGQALGLQPAPRGFVACAPAESGH